MLCDNPEEMADYIEKSQLTKDFGGELSFDPNEWTEHRSVSPASCQTLTPSRVDRSLICGSCLLSDFLTSVSRVDRSLVCESASC